MERLALILLIFTTLFSIGAAIWCFECASTQPGCGRDFNWYWHWSRICPEDDDICVKITDTHGAEEIITRSCLSSVRSFRKDVPADHYEGCRPAAKVIGLAHYVNNSIKELDIRRDNYQAEWCFCFLDHRCNSSIKNYPSIFVTLFGVALLYRLL